MSDNGERVRRRKLDSLDSSETGVQSNSGVLAEDNSYNVNQQSDTCHKTAEIQQGDKFRHSTESGGDITKNEFSKLSHESSCSALDSSTGIERLCDQKHVFGSLITILTLSCGVVALCILSFAHAWYMNSLHENRLWFSNIQEVEREISFRTESGLFFSYYKQLVQAESLTEGLYALVYDNLTESGNTVNILARMNVYQEVILATLYRWLFIEIWMEPVYFYLYAIFSLHGVLISSLFIASWILSDTWLSGVVTAAFYILNKIDATRVDFTPCLRESFSLPFLWIQLAAITYVLRPATSKKKYIAANIVVFISTFLFSLFWQFNQYVLLLQSVALFTVWILDLCPAYKVRKILIMQASSLIIVCGLQFFNKMIAGSISLSFIAATLILMEIKGDATFRCSMAMKLMKLFLYCSTALALTICFSFIAKSVLCVEADAHIYKFLMTKFGLGHHRDFDSMLYLCSGPFVFLPVDTYERLTHGVVLPIYAVVQVTLMIVIAVKVFKNVRMTNGDKVQLQSPKNLSSTSDDFLTRKPEFSFHTVQAMLFGMLGMSTMRMKYLWTPYMCILAGAGVGLIESWKSLPIFNRLPSILIKCTRYMALLAILTMLLYLTLPVAIQEHGNLMEFWDPDTVDLMNWIKQNTEVTAAFSGSMQLMAGVKLCTGRPIANHPHYEDRALRHRTKELYQMYGKRNPREVYDILKKYSVDYIILEDSICLSPVEYECRLPNIIDIDNHMIPESGKEEAGLSFDPTPRFCDFIRNGTEEYKRFFKLVFSNKTFRIYLLVN